MISKSDRGKSWIINYRYLLLSMVLFFQFHSIANAADPTQGSKFYAQHCTSCHGTDGRSQIPGGPDFFRGEALLQADMNILKVIKTGKGMMPGYQGVLKDSEILDVIAYLRTLR